ncbi:MAG TPA: hypothetical protein VKA86_14045 [Candidatus Krumholzibacteria bacterium]|nr:hypothetical protein [Candidatus Krumholzibacteria bacterium]
MTDPTHERSIASIHDDPGGRNWEPQIAEHVSRCPSCQRTLKALQAFVDSMRSRRRQAAPPDLVARVCRTVQAEQSTAVRRRWRLTVAAIPVALILGVLVGMWIA